MSNQALGELGRAVLEKGRPFRFRAGGWSMWPFIKEGDLVSLSPVSADTVRLGDVVAAVLPESGIILVHRAAGVGNKTILLRGDNASDEDGLIPKACVLGRVTGVERNGRTVRLGLGPERWLVPLLVRWRWSPLVRMFPRVLRSLFKI